MRRIVKGQEPPSLQAYRKVSGGDYEGYQNKDDLRTALVAEQRGLCCYCMGRIEARRRQMKIEHWRCVAKYPHEQLSYGNLLGACMGGEGKEPRLQHCDTRKADSDMRWNPADPNHRIELRIEYGADGSIRSNDEEFDRQLNEVLNLNVWHIKNARRGVHNAIVGWWKSSRRGGRSISRSRLKGEVHKLTDTPRMDAYSPVAIWWLKKKLAGMAS